MHESRKLVEVLCAQRGNELPPDAVLHARRAVLDWLGSAMAGSLEPPARIVQQVVHTMGVSEQATVFSAGRSSAARAALANGAASHILEYDDVHKGSTLHAAAPVISAALAVAEREHSSGGEFLKAVVFGYEAALRIGEAVNPSHYRFFHPTGTAATFGAAIAAGTLLSLDAEQMLDALGTAGTQAAGLWEFNSDGAMSKSLHPGKAAFNGVLSADLAKAGFTGASRILEGERGFFRAFAEAYDASRVTDGLGGGWKIGENCFKMHSCCAHTHTAIDAALELRPRVGPGVRSIHIHTYGPGYEIVKEMEPRTPYQAKFSIAYCVAAALAEGRVGLEQFADVNTPAVAALLAKTVVKVESDLTAKYPEAWPVRLEIVLDNGETLRAHADYPRGNPENAVGDSELEAKFRTLVSPRFGKGGTQQALDALQALPECADVSLLLRNLA